MSINLRANVILFLTTLLVSCASQPRYKTDYILQEPETSEQRRCVIKIKLAKDKCSERCQSKYDSCMTLANMNYQVSYDQYSRNRSINPDASISSPYKSDYTKYCHSGCGCDETFRENYEICGLGVEAESVCIKNCDQ